MLVQAPQWGYGSQNVHPKHITLSSRRAISDSFIKQTVALAPQFSGIRQTAPYAPPKSELDMLAVALKGGEKGRTVGANFFPSKTIDQDLQTWLNNEREKPTESEAKLITALTAQKADVVNFYNLVLRRGELVSKTDPVIQETVRQFLTDFKTQYRQCESRFLKTPEQEGFGLNNTDMALLRDVMVKTAPILFNMGFADAIPHAAQVSRLCGSLARQHLATPVQILQSIIVGWLHDCKLDGQWSVDNMATHPIVSSAVANAVAHDVLNDVRTNIDASMAQRAGKLNLTSDGRVSPFGDKGPRETSEFIRGIVESLSINNDSKWVLEEVILKQLKTQKPFLSLRLKDTLERWAKRRLTAGSEAEMAEALTPQGYSLGRWKSVLNQSSFGTGIYMLSVDAANKLDIAELLKPQNLNSVDLRQKIQHYPEIVKEVKLPGEYIFHHHLEASDSAYVPSLMLSNADPMLLSAHKVMQKYLKPAFLEQQTSYTTTKAFAEFIDSLEENIQLTDPRQRIDALMFQRIILLTLLYRAAAYRGESGYQWQYNGSLSKEIETLSTLLKKPATWGQDWMREPIYKHANEYERLLKSLETDYVSVLVQYREAIINALTPFEQYQGVPKSEEEIGTNYQNVRTFLPQIPTSPSHGSLSNI